MKRRRATMPASFPPDSTPSRASAAQASVPLAYGLLAVGALAISLRAPWLLTHPRMWAEEATVYFRQAYELPAWAALWRPHLGYFSLFNNIAVLLARSGPLEGAAAVTTGLAFAVQLLPVILIAFGRGPLLETPARRAFALAIVLLSPPSEEVWLNTINSQFHLALAAALIVFDTRTDSRSWTGFKFAVLALGALTGPVAALLAPAAVLWASQRRSAQTFAAAAVLTTGLLFQAGMMAWGPVHEVMPPRARPAPSLIAVVFVARTWVESWAGDLATPLLAALRARWVAGATALPTLIALSALVAATGWLLWQSPRRVVTGLLVATSLGMTAVSVWGAVGLDKSELLAAYNGGRYFYVPGVLWKLALLSAIALPREPGFRIRGAWPGALLTLSLAATALSFPGKIGRDGGMPDWRLEVARWREDPAHPIAIWPPGWGLQLPRAPEPPALR